ncbi:hypothetical protein ACQY0O_007586 [Thecaphora frezii]
MAPSTSSGRRRPRVVDDGDDDNDEEQHQHQGARARHSQRRSERTSTLAVTLGNGNGNEGAASTSRRPSALSACRPQPLDRLASAVVKQSASAYGPHEDFIRQAMSFLAETGEQVAEVEESVDNDLFSQLDSDYKELIDAQVECAARKKALDSIRRRLDDGQEITDAVGDYGRLVNDVLDQYQAKTSRQKYAAHEAYISFRESAWAAAEDGAMPPITEFIPAEERDVENSDDEIQIGGRRQDYKCPYSAKLLFDPLSSTDCPHSYDREVILQYIASGRDKVCPADGCNVILTKRNLRPDPKLAKRVAAFQRREEQRSLSNHVNTEVLD